MHTLESRLKEIALFRCYVFSVPEDRCPRFLVVCPGEMLARCDKIVIPKF